MSRPVVTMTEAAFIRDPSAAYGNDGRIVVLTDDSGRHVATVSRPVDRCDPFGELADAEAERDMAIAHAEELEQRVAELEAEIERLRGG